MSRTECLDRAAELGIEAVEFGTGCWSTAPHVQLNELLASAAERDRLIGEVKDRGLSNSALNCSGNPLHPGPSGQVHQEITRNTIDLAAEMKLERVVMMSGLPGAPGDHYPNWIITSWPPETTEILDWQ